ncbi:MAG: hypothetical protein AB1499_01690 [Nitrospirota bacterium]
MSVACIYCSGSIKYRNNENRFITHDICSQCIDIIFNQQDDLVISFLDNIEAPILLMQPDPRQVRTANKKACELFNKDLSQIERHRGGQVFDCIHSFTEAGCGIDLNCEECKIRNSVVETFTSGKSFNGVSTVLDIKKNNLIRPYNLQIATEKVRDLALMRIDRYEKLA